MQQSLATFNRGLASLQKSGKIDALYQRYILTPKTAR